MRRLCLALMLCTYASSLTGAQTPVRSGPEASQPVSPPTEVSPLLTPQAAFDQANLPLDITRRDSENWSDIELAALKVAVAQARDACLMRIGKSYVGSDLAAFSHLCAFGEQWQPAQRAATAYIEDKARPQPQLTEVYSYLIEADLKLGDEKAGFEACLTMLHSVPYDALADAITEATVRYLELAYTGDAITVLAERQHFLLQLLRASGPPAPEGPSSGASTAAIPAHTLLEHALELPALDQYDDEAGAAAMNLADIDSAMPSSLPPDEVVLIANDRREYALLGTRFPALAGTVSLLPEDRGPSAQPEPGSVTIYFLFPPWCAQCVKQAEDLAAAQTRMARGNGPAGQARIYALLADIPAPAPKPPVKSAVRPAPGSQRSTAKSTDKPTVTVTIGGSGMPNPQEALRDTPTWVVPPSTLAAFNASDFPFLIATDHDRTIRLMLPAASDNALQTGGPADQIVDFILERWSPSPQQ